MNQRYTTLNNNESSEENEYINLKLYFDILIRNKNSIAKITIIGLVISCIYALSLKRIWQGNFKIVVDKKDNSLMSNANLNLNSNLLNIAGIDQKSALKTEVQILNSPSVLLEIFENVKNKKLKKGNKSFKNTRFDDWQENHITINLIKGTSVLDLSYKDSDKDLILPVLNDISSKYQAYSGKSRSREIELGLEFLSNQIISYKTKSIDSLSKLQNYSESFDLGAPVILEKDTKKIQIDVESNRAKAGQEIRLINEKLKTIEELKDPEEIIYLGNTLNLSLEKGTNNIADTLKNIQKIDDQLVKKSFTYKETDKSFKKLNNEKKLMANLLEKQIKGFLNAKRQDALTLLETSKRPEGVLLQYRNLLKVASRDEAVLNNLENQYRNIQLEKARNKDPWELITKPSLLPYPVAPSRRSIALLGLILSFILGYLRAYILEKKRDVIFYPNEIEIDMNLKLISELSIKNKEKWGETFNIILNGISKCTSGTIGILPVQDIDDEINKEIKRTLNQTKKNQKITFCNGLQEAFKYDNLILLVKILDTSKKNIFDVNKKLILHKKNNLGTLVLIN